MGVVQVAEWKREFVRIGPAEAGASEHQLHVVVEDVVGDAAPQQLGRGPVSVAWVDAHAAELDENPGLFENRREVVLCIGVELARGCFRAAAVQPVWADDGPARAMIEHQQVLP